MGTSVRRRVTLRFLDLVQKTLRLLEALSTIDAVHEDEQIAYKYMYGLYSAINEKNTNSVVARSNDSFEKTRYG